MKLKNLLLRLFSPADEYHIASWLFLRALGLIYFIAFLSLAVQVDGLVGPNGILPLVNLQDSLYQRHGIEAVLRSPSVFWFNASDLALVASAYVGCILAMALLFGYWQRTSLILLFILYLSQYHANQIFLNFQWDTLLLEAGFLAIFLVKGPSRLLIFLFHWLLFRLRFMSGTSKIALEDPSWADFSSLLYYFETQPLPHTGSWYFHQLPEWMLRAGTGVTFFAELIVPFFIFLPRPFRIFAAVVTIAMQLLIIASSNHNFVNLLTIALCLFLLDDRLLKKLSWLKPNFSGIGRFSHVVVLVAGIAIFVSSLSAFYQMMITRGKPLPEFIYQPSLWVRSYGLGHIYHIFPTMQVERQELEVQGSYDGVHWQSYQFKYKPGDISRRPPLNLPHQPRLDWMVWFVPPQHTRQMRWYEQFLQSLYEGSPQVLKLLAHNPFKHKPPNYLRVLAYRYQFTTPAEREKTGNWWKRELLGEFPDVKPRRP